jgi:hypothetical protein
MGMFDQQQLIGNLAPLALLDQIALQLEAERIVQAPEIGGIRTYALIAKP